MIVWIDTPTVSLTMLIIRGKSWKIKLFPKPVWRIVKTSLASTRFFKQIFCSSQRNSTGRKCSMALFIILSKSAWLDYICLASAILHSSSTSLVIECWRRCHNGPIRGYTGIQYTRTTLCYKCLQAFSCSRPSLPSCFFLCWPCTI